MNLPRQLLRQAMKRLKVLLQHAALYVRERPQLKNAAWKVLNRFPRLKLWLFQAITPPALQQNLPMAIARLTPRARLIYADLKTAIAHRQKKYD